MLQGVIFDMDGVLVDNMGYHMESFAEVTRRYGVDADMDEVLGMAGVGNEDIFPKVFPREVIERVGVPALCDEKEAIYREIYGPLLTPIRGLIPLLESLKSSGIGIALGTSSGRENIDMVLDGLHIRHYFDAIVYADMVARTKPFPDIYLLALERLGLRAADCLVFEDAVAGIRAAQAAGVKVVGLATTLDKATLEGVPNVAVAIGDYTETNIAALRALV